MLQVIMLHTYNIQTIQILYQLVHTMQLEIPKWLTYLSKSGIFFDHTVRHCNAYTTILYKNIIYTKVTLVIYMPGVSHEITQWFTIMCNF